MTVATIAWATRRRSSVLLTNNAHPSPKLDQICRCWSGGACLLCPNISDINLFRYRESIIYLDAEVSDGAFDLGVPEQELHGAQITGTPVNQSRLGPS